MQSFKLLTALLLILLFSLATPTLAQEPTLTVERGPAADDLSAAAWNRIQAQPEPDRHQTFANGHQANPATPGQPALVDRRPAVGIASPDEIGPTAAVAPPGILQFTSGGHVLGFADDGVYAATGRHGYHVEFIAAAAAPLADTAAGSDILPLSRVTYPNLWPGITLSYDAPAGTILRSTYRLEPHADPAQIRLRYNAPVALDKDGSLVLSYDAGHMRESAPIAWQQINGRRYPIEVSFKLTARPGGEAQQVGFRLGAYNPAYPLFIDPSLVWHTFLGGTGDDAGRSLVTDSSGNVYVTGESNAGWGAPLNAHAGSNDGFVAKLNSSGALQWHTFLGGTGGDYGISLATDSSDNVYVTGYSSVGWGAPLNAHAGSNDGFVAKLNSSGALQWHTFLGGTGNDYGRSLATDSGDNVYVTGYSSAGWGAPLNAHAGGNDGFVAKFNSSGARQWHTFLGGAGADHGWGLAIDSSDNLYATGFSSAGWGAPLNAHAGSNDGFVAKLNSSGALQWHTFLGGTGSDAARSLVTDSSGNLYVTGESNAGWGTPLNAHAGSTDGFVAKLNSSGALQWHTFLGGTGNDYGTSLATDSSDNLYVTGYSSAGWGAPLNAYVGNFDVFVAKLNSSGARQWHTFLGGILVDYGRGLTTDSSGNLYVTGESTASWGAPLNPFAGGAYDIFVAKIEPVPEVAVLGNNTEIPDGDTTPSLTDHTNFGAVAVNSSLTRTFTISNSGDADLTLTGSPLVTITGSGGYFTLTQPPSSPVSSGLTTTFKIKYAPTAAGVHTATVAIENNDSDENPYTFVVSGQEPSACQLYPPASFTNKTTADGLGNNQVNGVYAEGSTVYAATGGGLSISTDGGSSFTNKTTSDGLGSNGVRNVYAEGSTVYAAAGGLSISTDGGGSFTNKTTSDGLGSNVVFRVYAEGSTVYAATAGGLSISTNGGSSFTNKTTSDGLGSNTVYDVYAEGSTVYAATLNGLSISADGGSSFTNKTTANGLGGNVVNKVYAEGSTVYAATTGGLSISTNGGSSFTNKTTANGLGGNNVSGVYAEGSTVYAATISGLSISTDGGSSFTNKTTANGLGTNSLNGVYADGSTVYAATFGGLSIGGCTSPPEIEVQGNSQSIPNGDTTPSLTDHTDFGFIAVNSSLTRTFTISNSGGLNLTLTGSPLVTITGSGGYFTLTQPPSSPVSSGLTTTFKIKYAPTAAGVHTATVAIENNDSDENPYTLVIQGESVASDLAITKQVTPATAQPGDAITYTLTFINNGPSSATSVVITDAIPISVTNISVISSGVTITDTGAAADFVWSVQDLTLGQGGTITLTGVLSDPLAAGSFTNTAQITSIEVDTTPSNNRDSALVTIDPDTKSSSFYFPLIVKDFEVLPDLIITDLKASDTEVTVTIVNTGTDPVVDAFWIDVYFDLDAPPGINQPWPTTDASHGVVWGLSGRDLPIRPGESRTLTLADATQFFDGEQVTSDPPYPVGVNVYGYVDSVKVGSSFAAVKESNEANNVFGPVTSGVSGGSTSSIRPQQSQTGKSMPAR